MSVPENRRLKIAGLATGGGGVGVFAWLGAHGPEFVQLQRSPTVFLVLTVVAVNLTAVGLLLLSAGCGLRTSWRNPRRRHAILLQVLLANILIPAVAYGVLSANDDGATIETTRWALPFEAAGLVVMVIAWRLWRRAQKYEAPDADEAMGADPRPPVLYLRSFKDDGSALINTKASRLFRPLFELLRLATPEQELAEILGHLGPVIAIGKPGEPLPELGAARLYVTHDVWQARVLALMQQASLIVIRVGASAGVLWEIECALSHVPRERIALFLMGTSDPPPELVGRLKPVLGAEIEAFLPDRDEGWLAWVYRDPRRRVGSLVCFPRGVPRAVPLTPWPPWTRDAWTMLRGRPSALPLRRGWRTAFAMLEHDAGMMSAGRPSRALAVTLALTCGWTGAHWFYLGHRRRGVKYLLLMLVFVSVFLAFYDALRFILADRETFDARYAAR